MSKKSRKKNQQKQTGNVALAKRPMDPAMIKAYAKGREFGFKDGYEQGEVDSMFNALAVFSSWIREVDKNVKGIGPSKRDELQKYFNQKVEESFAEKNGK